MSTIRLVAAREFTERLRSKAFVISNIIVVVVILGSVLLPVLFAGDDQATPVGVLGADAEVVVAIALAQQEAFDLDVEVVALTDRDAAEAALRDGEVDAVVLDATSVLIERRINPRLESLLASSVNAVQVDAALDAAGLTQAERETLFSVPPLAIERLDDDGEGIDVFSPSIVVVYAAVFLLYGLLVIYGQWVAQGIVEEKQSRVVEVLLASLRPSELLAGKILGLGALGLLQVALFAVIGVGGMLLTDAVTLSAAGWGALALVIPWYILGYLLYASLFAMGGALVARVEDLQSAIMPIILLLIGALLAAQFALAAPESAVATAASIVPFTAPIVQPVMIAAGVASAREVVLAVVLALGLIAALVPLAGRVYRGGALRTRGRVALREVLARSSNGG